MDFSQPSSALKRKQIARIIVPHAHIVRDFDASTDSFLQRRQQRRGIEILRFGVWMKTVGFAFLMAESQASFCGTLTHSWLGAPQGRWGRERAVCAGRSVSFHRLRRTQARFLCGRASLLSPVLVSGRMYDSGD
jgi:hypothetical protein